MRLAPNSSARVRGALTLSAEVARAIAGQCAADGDCDALPPEIEAEADRQLAAALESLRERKDAAQALLQSPKPSPKGARVQLPNGRQVRAIRESR